MAFEHPASRVSAPLLAAGVTLLSGCQSTLGSPGARVVLLVLLPAALVFAVLWLLARRRSTEQRPGPRQGSHPDYDERD